MRSDTWQIGLQWVFGALLLGLSGCGAVEKGSTCNLKGKGLSLEGYSGKNLNNLELSLVFLKGPSKVSEEIGHYLEEQHIEASFFVKGLHAEEEESALEKLAEQGHRLGSGGFTFTSLKDTEDPILELKTTDSIIAPFAYGNQFWLFGEEGSIDEDTLKQLNRAGLGKYVGPIHPDTNGTNFVTDEKCWEKGLTVSACAENYFNELVRIGHGIVPFHDETTKTKELIEELIPELKAYGFSFVRLDQIPDLRVALSANGGTPDAEKGSEVCHDYE